MTIARFPLVGSFTSRAVAPTVAHSTDQKFTNCFPEVVTNQITGKSSVVLLKRQGAAASSDVQASASGRDASCIWTSNSASAPPAIFAFVKSTATSMMFFDQSGTQIGGDIATTNNCQFLTDTLIGSTGNLTATLSDSGTNALEAWYFPEGGAWTQITDADFPSNIQPTHAHLDGYMFVITNRGVIHNSDVNSLSAWTAGASIAAQSMPDNGIGLARYKNFIVAFGDKSVEFFYNAGNATGSPLSRVDNSIRRIGAMRDGGLAPTIMAIGDTVYWVGTVADSGAYGIYRLNGFQPEKVSPPVVDRLISDVNIKGIGGAITLFGKTHVVFTTSSSTVLMFCVETGIWWYFILAAGALIPRSFTGFRSTQGQSYLITGDAKIYRFDAAIPLWQDNALAYTMTVQTDNLDHGTHKRKFYKNIALIGDTQSAASAVGVSWSDDDYATFSTARDIDMNATQRRLFRLGSSRRRAWKFTHAANTPCRLEAVEIDYELGQS